MAGERSDRTDPPKLLSKRCRLLDSRGHRQRLRDRFRKGGRKPFPTTSSWSWCCSAPFHDATPRISPSRCIARFGSFAEVVNAPERASRRSEGAGEAVITELKLIRAAALRLMQRQLSSSSPCCRRGARCSIICRAAQGYEAARALPYSVPRQEEPPHRRRGAQARARWITPRSTCAKL